MANPQENIKVNCDIVKKQNPPLPDESSTATYILIDGSHSILRGKSYKKK